ncbi:hypothetical protein VPH5P1C_0221 [Vibrio phage 5P1c]|nr:conserved hypothetical protein [Vibrio phage 495E54-1]CAH9014609.1 conserved hypothetical protein [Vibrio phage 496E54-1]
MLENLKKQVEGLLVKNDIELLDEIAKEVDSGEWEGAGDWFGHTDDCFDRGIELGRAEAFEVVLGLISEMEEK